MEDLQIVKRNIKKPSDPQILAMNSNQPMTKFSLLCQKVLADQSWVIKHGQAPGGSHCSPMRLTRQPDPNTCLIPGRKGTSGCRSDKGLPRVLESGKTKLRKSFPFLSVEASAIPIYTSLRVVFWNLYYSSEAQAEEPLPSTSCVCTTTDSVRKKTTESRTGGPWTPIFLISDAPKLRWENAKTQNKW